MSRYKWLMCMTTSILLLTGCSNLGGGILGKLIEKENTVVEETQAEEELMVEEEEDTMNASEIKDITSSLRATDIYQINDYLSPLASINFKGYSEDSVDDSELLRLGFSLFITDYKELIGSEMLDGESYFVYQYDDFNRAIQTFFDYKLSKSAEDPWIYKDNKFYYPEIITGFMPSTVPQINKVSDLGNDTYLLEGLIYDVDIYNLDYMYGDYLEPKNLWLNGMGIEKIESQLKVKIQYSKKLDQYVIRHYQITPFDENLAIQLAKEEYGEDDDTIYVADTEEYNDYDGSKYYQVTLKSKSMMERGGSGTLFSVLVYEDGEIIEYY